MMKDPILENEVRPIYVRHTGPDTLVARHADGVLWLDFDPSPLNCYYDRLRQFFYDGTPFSVAKLTATKVDGIWKVDIEDAPLEEGVVGGGW